VDRNLRRELLLESSSNGVQEILGVQVVSALDPTERKNETSQWPLQGAQNEEVERTKRDHP
jgi:hypothetical protein